MHNGGGGGGGTIFDGGDSTCARGAVAHTSAVAQAAATNNGHGATCPGGGGGGGGYNDGGIRPTDGGDGADGAYGGGGGAGRRRPLHGDLTERQWWQWRFWRRRWRLRNEPVYRSVAVMEEMADLAAAQASASAPTLICTALPETAGRFGGGGNGSCCGGGGGALGGAIFNQGGVVVIRNSTFTHNDVDRGEGGVSDAGTDRASNGGDAGAAIFSLNGLLSVENATISDNFSTGSGGGIVVVADPLGLPASVTATFRLFNTIISRNGDNECILEDTPDPINGHVGTVDAQGSGNLILNNNGCPGVAVTTDPQLAALAVDQRSQTGTPTLALPSDSAAVNAGDDDHILPTDQRGVARPQGPHSDIGAFEFAPLSADLTLTSQTSAAQIVAGGSFTYTVQLTNHGPDDADRCGLQRISHRLV